MGNVWRADRPQRGRFRQFMQCDIDILGEPSNLAEIELILATTTTLGKLGFKGFEIRINDRQILKAMAAYSGFPEDSYDSVFITLDKMDKIGLDGVEAELLEKGFSKESVEKYLRWYLMQRWFAECLTIPAPFLKLRFPDLAEAAVAAADMTRWWVSLPDRMFLPAAFPSALKESLCC